MSGVSYSTWRKCQFCKEDAEGLVKYGVRHYAHAACLYRRRGEKGLKALPLHELETLPVIPLARAGLPFARLSKLIDEEKAERLRTARVRCLPRERVGDV